MNLFCNPNDDGGCPERIVCRCLQITEATLVEALADGAVRTLKEVRRCTGAGDGCTACHALLRQYLERHAHSAEPICSLR